MIAMRPSPRPIQIDVVYDTVCPWCFIGKRRLEQALALRPHIDARLNWRPFLINPEMPIAGIDRQTDLIRKFGSQARVERIFGAINEAGLSVQIDFAFARITRTPNAVNSHRLIFYAAEHGIAVAIVEAIYVAFFRDGQNIGEIDVLVRIAETHGLDPGAVRTFLDQTDGVDAVLSENANAHRLGVNGVPSFVFNSTLVIAGAQEPQVIARMLDAAQATAEAAE